VRFKKFKLQAGFTFIELILYIALVSIFLTGAILFSWDISYGREKAFQQQLVGQNARLAMERIAYEIRRAEDIDSVSGTSLVLNNGGASTTTITYTGGQIQITTGGAGPYDLTSDDVVVLQPPDVSDPLFEDLTTTDINSKDIKVNLTIRQADTGLSQHYEAEVTLSHTVELNSQFDQGRRMIIDNTDTHLSASGRFVSDALLGNTGPADFYIDQIEASWTGTAGGENITGFNFDSGAEEWSGSQPSGSIIDITDQLLASGTSTRTFEFSFDSDMAGADVLLGFILTDGSFKKILFELPSGEPTATPTPGPTATPTPTPPVSTCSQYCQFITYSGGTCRQNPVTCTSNGETYESGGDTYCTGGPLEDTCCCAP